MGFTKRAFTQCKEISPLNTPEGKDMDMFNSKLTKISSIKKTKDVDLNNFDLEAAVKEYPSHLFVKAFAIKANEVNDNGDAFSEDVLKESAKTFIGCPVFVNHENDNVEKARGVVAHAWYDDDAKGIYVVNRVDKEAYPRLARGIEQNIIIGTSMGCTVGFSVCSVCHNKAHTADQFCEHIRERKGKKYNGKIQCRYHESSCEPQDSCPLCGCEKDSTNMLEHDEQEIFEWNYNVGFIEDSFVVSPACHDCLVSDVLNVPEVEKTIKSSSDNIKKIANNIDNLINQNMIQKESGLKEINSLNDAMNILEGVARSMMAQKNMVSMDYVSDIVEQLSKLQGTTDELIEQGYAQVPSPKQSDQFFGSQEEASPLSNESSSQISDPNSMVAQQDSMLQNQSPQIGNNSAQNPINFQSQQSQDQIATVTSPTFANFKKDFLNKVSMVKDSIDKIEQTSKLLNDISSNRRKSVNFSNQHTYASDSSKLKVTIAQTDDGETYVSEFDDKNLLQMTNVDAYDENMKQLILNQPREAAMKILASRSGSVAQDINNTEQNNMKDPNPQTKTAAGSGVNSEQQEMITEKQLSDADLTLHNRWGGGFHEGITESDSQIGGREHTNDTTTESPQVRRGSYDTITQDQFAEIKDGYICRWSSFPEIITEKQWNEMSRDVHAALPSDWTDSITQAQLISLRDDHRWVDPEVITQSQLGSQESTMPNTDETSRFKQSSHDDKYAIAKHALNAVSEAISRYKLSPEDIRKVASTIFATPQNQMKAIYLTLCNSIPQKIAERQDEISRGELRDQYFGKQSSRNKINDIDAFVSAMADNIGYHKGEDFMNAISSLINNQSNFKAAEIMARQNMAKQSQKSTLENNNSFDAAFSRLNKEAEKQAYIKLSASIKDDIGIDPSNKHEFTKAAYKFATSYLDHNNDAIMISLDVDENAGTFDIILKDKIACSDEELSSFAEIEKSDFKFAMHDEDYEEDKEDYEDEKDYDEKDYDEKDYDEKDYDEKDYDEKEKDKEDYKEDEDYTEESDEHNMKYMPKESRSQNRMQMIKEAQLMGGQMPAQLGEGQGGGTTLPSPPDDGGIDPIESFEQQDPFGSNADDVPEDLQPKPPGSICPVCGSDDVDIIDGEGKCRNCGAEWDYKVSIEFKKYPGLLDGDDKESDSDTDDAGSGEGFELGEDENIVDPMPVAASTRLTDQMLKKVADNNGGKVIIGNISPYSGSKDTVSLGKNKDGSYGYFCNQSGNTYNVRFAKVKNQKYAQWEFAAATQENCSSCDRARSAFKLALKRAGTDINEFMKMSSRDKGSLILSMRNNGHLNIKTAFKKTSATKDLKMANAFAPGDKFPIESCREKLARRFGQDSIALSGPCEGKNLPDCVCSQLKTANVYSDRLAYKFASIWGERDGSLDCIEDYVRSGFAMEKSAQICDTLKDVFATMYDFVSDEMEDKYDSHDHDNGDYEENEDYDTEMSDEMENHDPFDSDNESEDAIINVSLEDMEDSEEMPLPEDSAETIDEIARDALDTAQQIIEEMQKSVSDDGDEEYEDEAEDEDESNDGEYDMNNDEYEANDENNDEYDENNDEYDEEELDAEIFASAENFRKGRISKTGSLGLDTDLIAKSLRVEASDKTMTQHNAQDDPDLGTISNAEKSKMGHEEKYVPQGPKNVSQGTKSTIGSESKDVLPTDEAHVPAGYDPMGHEEEAGLTPEKGHQYTGGEDGAGNSKSAQSQSRYVSTSNITERLADSLLKSASEKKLKEKEPVSDDEDIQPISENRDHSNTPESASRKPFEDCDQDAIESVPQRGNESFMGHEEESLEEVSSSPESHPEFPADGRQNEKYDKEKRYQPEKGDRAKGTVIARSDSENQEVRVKAATTLAAKMVKSNLLDPDKMQNKIAEFARYEVEQIKDLENYIFSNTHKKGLDTAPGGNQTPIVINASSNKKSSNPAEELTNKLQGLFGLQKQIDATENDAITDQELRNYFGGGGFSAK